MRRRFLKLQGKRAGELKFAKDLPMRCLNKLGLLEGPPWELGECVPESCDALCLHFEATLLRH